MENEEKRNTESKFNETSDDTSHRGVRNMFGAMAGCCEGMSGSVDCKSMMGECMRKCRWFLLVPVTIGILLLGVGYLLDPEITRILWMTAAGFMVLIGILAFLMMGIGKKTCC